MKPLFYSDGWVETYPETYEYVQTNFMTNLVYYFINSKYRKMRNVKSWIKPQAEQITEEVAEYIATVPINNTEDFNAVLLLKKVKNYLRYIGDLSVWNMMEYWQTIHETYKLKTGDCEDGTIMLYCFLRYIGIPANRLMLFAGDVWDPYRKKIAGHCWLGYRPKNYPFHFAFLDWCYYFNSNSIANRPVFFIKEKKIFEYRKINGSYKYNPNSNYKSIWFGWNEGFSTKSFELR